MAYLERDISIYYTVAGPEDAPAILFCHGAGGNAASWWHQFGEFSRDYRCIAFDHRGFGRSSCTEAQFTPAEFAADALAILDAVHVEAAHFVCQSMGGWTGVRAALEQPSRVKRLVLSDTIGGIALQSGIDSVISLADRIREQGLAHVAVAEDFAEKDPAGAFLYAQIADFNRLPGAGPPNLFAKDVLVPLEVAAKLTLPILVFSGRQDVIWPPAVLHELAGHLPTARVVDIDSGHSPYFENHAAFNRALREFLS